MPLIKTIKMRHWHDGAEEDGTIFINPQYVVTASEGRRYRNMSLVNVQIQKLTKSTVFTVLETMDSFYDKYEKALRAHPGVEEDDKTPVVEA